MVEAEATESMETVKSEMSCWQKMVALVQVAFQEGHLAEEATWQAVVLISKVGRYLRGIKLVEVMCKMMTVILNRRFTISIAFHDVLHGFRAGCGTVTASFEAKLIQQLTEMREGFVYVILLDLQKAYEALDNDRCLEILEG